MPQVSKIGNNVARTTVGALVGGTISEATGGKFANGAVSGAIQGAMAKRPAPTDPPQSVSVGEIEQVQDIKQMGAELRAAALSLASLSTLTSFQVHMIFYTMQVHELIGRILILLNTDTVTKQFFITFRTEVLAEN